MEQKLVRVGLQETNNFFRPEWVNGVAYHCIWPLVEVQNAENSEGSLTVVVESPWPIYCSLCIVAHPAVVALEGGGQVDG